MVIVYVWNFLGAKVAWGHASMEVTEGQPAGSFYISWWPSGNGRDPKFPGSKGGLLYSTAALRGRRFDDDCAGEAEDVPEVLRNRLLYDSAGRALRLPDHAIRIPGLNESAIKRWWTDLNRGNDPTWRTLSKNCSTIVARGLSAGGADRRLSGTGWWHSWNVVWHPQRRSAIRAGDPAQALKGRAGS